MTDDRGLMALGMAPLLAQELASQIEDGTGDARRLMLFVMPSVVAPEVARQVTKSCRTLCAAPGDDLRVRLEEIRYDERGWLLAA